MADFISEVHTITEEEWKILESIDTGTTQVDHGDGSYTIMRDGQPCGFGCSVDIPRAELTGDIIGDLERALRKKALSPTAPGEVQK